MAKISLKACKQIYKKITPWQKVLLFCIIVLIINYCCYPKQSIIEGFDEINDFKVYNNDELFDSFYCAIYDDLVKSDLKNAYEIGIIKNNTTYNNKSMILDVGSGTGHHVSLLSKGGASVIGLDKSKDMIKIAKKLYPKLDYRQGNVMNTMIFQDSVFTHITCLYFTIYYLKNKEQFFQNCYKWLVPNGTLTIHLVDKFKFDPIIDASDPFINVSPQKYAKKRITNSTVAFDRVKYAADFTITKSDEALFEEKITPKISNGKARVNKHTFYMPTQTQIIGMAKNAGFIMLAKSNMKDCSWDDQYLYILQKPS